MSGEMSEHERAIRQLVYAVTGVGLPGGSVWETYQESGIRAEVMQDETSPDVLVWVWNEDRDSDDRENEGFSILLGCAEMGNFGEWTPEVVAAFKVVTEYMMTAQRKQLPWKFSDEPPTPPQGSTEEESANE
jgi:hypothetical protein